MDDEQNKFVINGFAHHLMLTLDEVLGKNEMDDLLRASHLEQYIDNYPVDEFKPGFPVSGLSALRNGLSTKYGNVGDKFLRCVLVA